jgi:aqualysin 1
VFPHLESQRIVRAATTPLLSILFASLALAGCSEHETPFATPRLIPQEVARAAATDQVIPNTYIVVFKQGVADAPGLAQALVQGAGGTLHYTYAAAIKGFAAELPSPAVAGLRMNPNVEYIESDQSVQVFGGTETAPPSWGLDRVDQRTLPLDASYSYASTGAGVSVYIIDTGIRTSHVDFGGRAAGAFSSAKGKSSTDDCHGHGTHVAGTVGGNRYGIAKSVRLYAVRVLDCTGNGSYSAVIAGVDWVTANRRLPAVANMSLGGSFSQALNDAVTASIASGVTYAIAAGNSATNACQISPASTPDAITLGATNKLDEQASYSNFGSCVDLYAPGSVITSAGIASDTASAVMSGTSMATPHAAGAAALYLETHPTDSPASVAAALTAQATSGIVTKIGTGSPNRLLYTGSGAQPSPSPTPTPCTPSQPQSKNCK